VEVPPVAAKASVVPAAPAGPTALHDPETGGPMRTPQPLTKNCSTSGCSLIYVGFVARSIGRHKKARLREHLPWCWR